MTVITISRKLGSDGKYIAQEVAQRLGYYFVDKEFIGAVLGEYGLADFDRKYDHLPTFWEKFDSQKEDRRVLLAEMVIRVLQAVAQHGDVVILGRSGYVALEGFADVLNVRLQASDSFRIGQIAARQKIDVEQAAVIVERRDKVRAAFVNSFYGVDWEECNGFDLLINRGKISAESTIEWLVDAAGAMADRVDDGQQTAVSLQIDRNLAATIADELAR